MAREWRQLLELKLRKCSKEAFQTFVADFMTRLHPDDFTRVRPHGKLGDGGMDGYLESTNTLFQCYGAQNGVVTDIPYVKRKMAEDFELARSSTPGMKEWAFTFNIVDLPHPIVQKFHEIKAQAASHSIKATLFGPDSFRSRLKGFSEDDLEDLIGIRVFNDADIERLPFVVAAIFDSLIRKMDDELPEDLASLPVPREKFEFNDIPGRWRDNLKRFLPHAPIVETILASQPDGRSAEMVPAYIHGEYERLKAQALDPGTILVHLHEHLAGYVNGYDGRYEAAMVILSSMFESCIIFEDKKRAPAPDLVDDIA